MTGKQNVNKFQRDEKKQAQNKTKGVLPPVDIDVIPMSYSRTGQSVKEIQSHSVELVDIESSPQRAKFQESFINKYYASFQALSEKKESNQRMLQKERSK
jgi:hypothetical protein